MDRVDTEVQVPSEVDIERRDWMAGALAGLSVLALGEAGIALAGNQPKAEQTTGHLVTHSYGEATSRIPGFRKVTLATLTYQPGDRIRFRMDAPAICQVTEGRLEARRAGESFVANAGYFWTCNTGDECESVNRGPGIAVMRYFTLLPS